MPEDYLENAPGHVGQPGIFPGEPPVPLPGEEEGQQWQYHGPFDHLGRPPEHPALPPWDESVPAIGGPPGTIPIPPVEATGSPVVIDEPYIEQAGSTVSCTMGNWEGEPTSRTYQWKVNGTSAGSDSATYSVVGGDVGKTIVCDLIATNAAGSSAVATSNSLVIT